MRFDNSYMDRCVIIISCGLVIHIIVMMMMNITMISILLTMLMIITNFIMNIDLYMTDIAMIQRWRFFSCRSSCDIRSGSRCDIDVYSIFPSYACCCCYCYYYDDELMASNSTSSDHSMTSKSLLKICVKIFKYQCSPVSVRRYCNPVQ